MSNGPPDRDPSPRKRRGIIKSSLDFAGGLFLLAIAAVGFGGAFSLPVGHLSSIGSGLLPKTIAVTIAAFGALLIIEGLSTQGDHLERWGIRGPFFVLSSVVVFGLTIRPLGLAIAGPLTIIVSAFADKDTRPTEILIFAVGLTALCIGMFKFMLHLPIPIFPPGYELF